MLLGISGNARLFLYSGPADMRKGFDGLSGLVTNKLRQNPLSGDIFIFINPKQWLKKVLEVIPEHHASKLADLLPQNLKL